MLRASRRHHLCLLSSIFSTFITSFSFIPTTDKPARVHNNSAALIDNILVSRFDYNITSGNIISDDRDHYSQFRILHSVKEQTSNQNTKNRDFSNFRENDFIAEIAHTNWD